MTLPPAAAAALGLPEVPPEPPSRIAFVDVEDAPKMIEILDPSTGEPLGWYAKFENPRLTDKMAEKARAVCDVVDAGECEANGCLDSPDPRPADGNPRRGAAIGWVLAGEADERTEWEPMTLVQRGRHVIAVCLTCSPSNVYDGLWPTDD